MNWLDSISTRPGFAQPRLIYSRQMMHPKSIDACVPPQNTF